MAIKKKSPLYEITDPTDPDYVDPDAPGTPGTPGYEPPVDENLMKSDLFADEVFGADITKFGSGVQQVDTTGIDERISQIEKPTGGSVWEKQAAYYRQKGEGDVLRMQKDVASLFLPTITLWQEREAAASAKFELLKQQMPEFDDTLIFGAGGENKTPMPVVDEIKNISTSVKADLKELSRLNVNDPRYDELRKKIEKEQGVITQFHEINQKLLAIRNDIGEDGEKLGNNIDGDWSDLMDDNEKAMWRDIYNSNGENIKVIDGKLMWVPESKVSYDFGRGKYNIWREKVKSLGGEKEGLGFLNDFSQNGSLSSKEVESWVTEGFEGYGSQRPYYVDLGIREEEPSKETLEKIASIGGADKGDLWGRKDNSWIGGRYTTKKKADIRLSEAQQNGFTNASIYIDEKSPKVLQLQRELKKLYPNHNFGTTGDNSDGIDGEWGLKTQAAYEMYIRDKDKLETEWFDENLSEKDKEIFQKVTPGKNIDLALIGDGPKMKNGIAFRTHLGSVNNLELGLNAGARLNSKNEFERNKYKALRLSIEDDFKGMGVEGQASLLFDGTGRIGETDALAVDVFLDDIMANNEGAFPDYKSMNEEQRINAWNGIRENGMLETYTLNGKEASLQTHFKDFYMGEIDKKAMAYTPKKTSKVIDKNKGKGKTYDLTNSSVSYSFNVGSETEKPTYSKKFGNRTKISKVKLETGEITTTKDDIMSLTKREFKDKTPRDYKITTDGIIQYYEDGEWKNSGIMKDSNNTNDIEDYNTIINEMNRVFGTEYGAGTEFTKMTKLELFKKNNPDAYISDKDNGYSETGISFARIRGKKAYFSQNKDLTDMYGYDMEYVDDYLLDYRDDDVIVKTLNRAYGNLGFSFQNSGSDEVLAHIVDMDGIIKTHVINTNRVDKEDRKKDENDLINWMSNMWKNYMELGSTKKVKVDSNGDEIKYNNDGRRIMPDSIGAVNEFKV